MTNQIPLTLRSPDDVLAMVTTVFGFHPADSLVLVSRTQTASFHARVDLPPDDGPLPDVAEYLSSAALRNDAREAAVVVYSADPQRATAAADELCQRLEAAGVPVVSVLREHDGRWFLLDDSHPGPGHVYDLRDHPLILQSRFDDREIFDDREALAASLRGSPQEIAAVDAHLDSEAGRVLGPGGAMPGPEAIDDYIAAEKAWAGHRLEAGVRLDDTEVARLCLAISFVDVRDRAWAMISADNALVWADTWKAIVRRIPSTVVAPAASLLAFAAWLSGNGALAWCAVDLAREADPHYSLANLLADALEQAVPPSSWEPPEEFARADKAG
jgi:hypothetical protein